MVWCGMLWYGIDYTAASFVVVYIEDGRCVFCLGIQKWKVLSIVVSFGRGGEWYGML